MSQHLIHRLKALSRDVSGNVAMIFALALPALIVIGLGAIELMNLSKDRSRLQDIADAAALNAASQMRLAANDQLLARAAALATGNTDGLTATMEAPVVRFLEGKEGPSGIEVALTARRTSFFGNLLPPGGFVIRVVARAQQLGSTPLCVLGLSPSAASTIDLRPGSIIARSCLVHSNKDITLQTGSEIDAAAAQASGAITGGSVSNSGTSAPSLDDPLAGMFTSTSPGPCQHTSQIQVDDDDETAEVEPGVHCRKFDIEEGTLLFLPGVHHLKQNELQLKEGARIIGDNVTLVIWRNLELTFSDGQLPLLSLTGSKGDMPGAAHWAGFALAVDPGYTDDLELDFREIRQLEGVVYAPNTRVIVPGGINSAEVTPWTVIVARELHVKGSRSLQINADYATSAVPVPNGVGNKATGGSPVRLTH